MKVLVIYYVFRKKEVENKPVARKKGMLVS